jgi:hypothetical protein
MIKRNLILLGRKIPLINYFLAASDLESKIKILDIRVEYIDQKIKWMVDDVATRSEVICNPKKKEIDNG